MAWTERTQDATVRERFSLQDKRDAKYLPTCAVGEARRVYKVSWLAHPFFGAILGLRFYDAVMDDNFKDAAEILEQIHQKATIQGTYIGPYEKTLRVEPMTEPVPEPKPVPEKKAEPAPEPDKELVPA